MRDCDSDIDAMIRGEKEKQSVPSDICLCFFCEIRYFVFWTNMGEMVQLELIRFTLLEFFQNGDKLLLTSVN